ncbi:GNAT family N-acetyltransferase [Vallitaleaceae bacterium 9-2]
MNTSLSIHSNRIIFVSTSKYHASFKRLSQTDAYYRFAFDSALNQDGLKEKDLEDADALQYDIFTNNKVILGVLKCYYPVKDSNLWIQTLIIRKEFARSGYGTLIFKRFVETLIRQYSIKKIFLTCHKDNVAGISFWQQQGFVRQDEPIKNDYYLFVANIRSLSCIEKYLTH